MLRKLLALIAAALCFGGGYAADCTVTVATENAHGDGRRLFASATPGEYIAKVDAGQSFDASVLADAGYVIAETGHILPEGASFNTTIGFLSIPAETLAAHAAEGVRVTIATRPIKYQIRYYAYGDGAPAVSTGEWQPVDGERSWLHSIDTATDTKTTLATAGTLHAEGWSFRGWSRVQGQTKPDFQPGEAVDHLTVKDGAVIKLYAVWATEQEEGKVSYPIVLQNGDFESPVVDEDKYYKMYAGAIITETEIQDRNGIGWSTTAKDNMVEIGRLTASGAASQYGTSTPRDGQQIAELNANVTGLLYQRISTLPNQTLHWGFSHRARGSEGMKEETMSMWIGSSDQIEKARAIYDRFALLDKKDANYLTREEAMAQIDRLAKELQFTNVVHTAVLNSDKTAWDELTGEFVVPSERHVTEYAFASWAVSTNGLPTSYGNLLDRVYLSDIIPSEKHNLRMTTGTGGTVWVNDSSAMTEIGPDSSFLASYDRNTKILLAMAMDPNYSYTGVMSNGVFVARGETMALFESLSRDGLEEDLSLDFVFAGDSLVQFRPNGGAYLDAEGKEISSEKLSLTKPVCTPGEAVRQGYTFLGWRARTGKLLASGASIVYEVGADGTAYLVGVDKDGTTELLRTPAADGLTLFAQWEIDEDAVSQRQTWEVTMVAQNVNGDNAIMKRVESTPYTWQGKAYHLDDFVTTVFPAEGFRLPETITVKDATGNLIDGYRYSTATGILVIPGRYATGNLLIEITGERIRYMIVYASGGSGDIDGEGVKKVPDSVGVWQQEVVADGAQVRLAGQGTLASEGWVFLGWARSASATAADYEAGALVDHLTRLDLTVVKLYGIWQAKEGSTASSYPVSLENGSFEAPPNEDPPSGYTRNFYVQYTEGVKGLNWYTTASDSKIEIGSVSTNLNLTECIKSYHTALARDGVQFAELNAAKIGALYQDVATVPGVTLYWGFSHKAREAGDALALIIGSPEEFEQALAIYTAKQSAAETGWQQAVLDEIAAKNFSSLQVTYHLADYDVSDLYGWEDLTGEYKVPDGQDVTKFAFLSLSTNGNPSLGNLIDQVYFTTSEPIQTATLTVLASAGGAAKVSDGAGELVPVKVDEPYFKVVAFGQRVAVSPIAEEGWSFLGLYAGTEFYKFAECDSLLDFEMPSANRKLTLLFARERTITFNAEGGTYPVSFVRLSASVPENELGTPVRAGYVFKGWRELTSGNVYAAGEKVKYEVEAQYDENVHSYLTVGADNTLVSIESEKGMVLSAVWEIAASAVAKKLITFVDRDYTSTASPQPFVRLYYSLIAVGNSVVPRNQEALKGIFENTTKVRPQGHEPTGWSYEIVDGVSEFDFDYIHKVEHKSDSEAAYFLVSGVTNGVYDTFRFDGVESMRFVARWDRFYDVVRLEDDGVTTNRTVWVPKSWLDAKGYTAIDESSYKTDLEQSGQNDVPLWQSYVFGLDPTNAASVGLNRPFHLRADGKVTMALDGVKVVKYLNDIYEAKSGSTLYSSWSGRDYRTYKVRFALMGANDRVNGPWTQVGEEQETPEFKLAPDELVYRYYRIEGRVDRP